MLKLQEYLRNCPDSPDARAARLRQLSERYSISVKRHPRYPELVMFKYDQINSPMADPLVQECRGIILNEKADWAPVSWPFHKFFNYEEPNAAEIDWASACVFEKLDGSLICMYYYDGLWQVSTSGTPDAGGQVFSFGKTFAELFWETFYAMGLRMPEPGWERFTFMWELMTPLNRVVVAHHNYRVALIGIRDNVRGMEVGVYQGPSSWPKVKAFDMGNIADVMASFKTIDPMDQEGYVVVDKNFNRVKVKHPQYVVLHHMRGNGAPTPKRALECVLAGEHTEFLSYWPEWKELFGDVTTRLALLENELEADYKRIVSEVASLELVPPGVIVASTKFQTQLRKEFALRAQKTRCPSVLFTTWTKGASSVSAALRGMNLDRLAELLRLKNVEVTVGE